MIDNIFLTPIFMTGVQPSFLSLFLHGEISALSTLAQAAKTLGWKNVETDWRKVIANPEIDVIDISTPGNLHAEIAIAAAKAGRSRSRRLIWMSSRRS